MVKTETSTMPEALWNLIALAPREDESTDAAARGVHLGEQDPNDAENHAEAKPREDQRQHRRQVDACVDLGAGRAKHARGRDQRARDRTHRGEVLHKTHKMGVLDAKQAFFEKANTDRKEEDGQEDRLRHGKNKMDDRFDLFGKKKPSPEKEPGGEGKGCREEEGDRHF